MKNIEYFSMNRGNFMHFINIFYIFLIFLSSNSQLSYIKRHTFLTEKEATGYYRLPLKKGRESKTLYIKLHTLTFWKSDLSLLILLP